MKKGHFELGGNDPFLVLRDADIQRAAEIGYKSRMGANAQACINAKRFIVEASVYDKFKEALIAVIQSQTVIGDPLDDKTTFGPLALARQKDLLISQVAAAVKDGAKISYGQQLDIKLQGDLCNGNFVQPIVTEGILTKHHSFHLEFFGPVFNLYQAQSAEDCLNIANDSDYGLAGTVFTQDLEQAQRIADRMQVGSVAVNDMMASFSDQPSGGVKMSGYGKECYRDGLWEIGFRKSIVGL